MVRIRMQETLEEAHITSCCYIDKRLIYASLVKREAAKMSSISSSILLGRKMVILKKDSYSYVAGNADLSAMTTRIRFGKDSFVHTIIYPNNNRVDKIFMYDGYNLNEKLYDKLMQLYDLPLLKEWIKEIRSSLERQKLIHIKDVDIYHSCDNHLSGKMFCMLSENLNQEKLDDIVKALIKFKKIELLSSEKLLNYKPLMFKSIDEFYIKYGERILSDVVKKITPIIKEPKAYLENVVLQQKVLYPPQAYVSNGASITLDNYKSAFMLETMGAGKTIQAFAVAEDYNIRKYRRRNPHATREEAIEKVTYRNIVMSPGHILEKWKMEIEKEIPYAKVEILDSFKKVVELAKQRGVEPDGKYFYIISKDFSKLGFVSYPLVKKESKRLNAIYKCRTCSNESEQFMKVCERCSSHMEVEYTHVVKGAICPHCNTVLRSGEEAFYLTDFENMNASNSVCRHCGESLWAPLTQRSILEEIPWKRYKIYRNATKNGTRTLWVHDSRKKEIRETGFGMFVKSEVNPVRKFPPSLFIRKKLGKNFFDVFICDEAHQYKAGGSAQGNAMYDIVKSSKKVLALTGTIAGGYANDVFHLFWRTKSWLMKKQGWTYKDAVSFSEKYGTVERKYEIEEGNFNQMSRGRAIGAPAVKPGISPLIYTDYMFEDTVYLDIGDLSSFMPNYYEYINMVELDDEISCQYSSMKNDFLQVLRDKNDGNKLASSMLQTLLAYPDKPFGYEPILHPKTGEVAIEPFNFEFEEDVVLNKEQELLDILNKELKEGRNCFVYCEFTGNGDKNVTTRLKQIIEKHCDLYNSVAILDSSGPSARQREAYIHKKASEGIKVFITNPKLTETGRALVSA